MEALLLRKPFHGKLILNLQGNLSWKLKPMYLKQMIALTLTETVFNHTIFSEQYCFKIGLFCQSVVQTFS